MPDLNFEVQSVEAAANSVSPLLMFKLRITQSGAEVPIEAVALRCQIRVEPMRRRYSTDEEDLLFELFGRREQWSRTLRSMLWTHASTVATAFTSDTVAELPVPCTYDFNVAMTKYFDALADGDVPLSFLFSGTIFYSGDSGALQAAPIPWDKEATFRLPVNLWRRMIQQHFPNTAWLYLDKNVFDRLRSFKTQAGHITWDDAILGLLQAADQKVPG